MVSNYISQTMPYLKVSLIVSYISKLLFRVNVSMSSPMMLVEQISLVESITSVLPIHLQNKSHYIFNTSPAIQNLFVLVSTLTIYILTSLN